MAAMVRATSAPGRTAKPCGPASRAIREATEAIKPGLQEHGISRRPIVQEMPDRSGGTYGDQLACFCFPPRLRVHRAPGIPCVLYHEGTTHLENSGKTRLEIVNAWLS